jgi:sigma-B regulation protein RsbU (phosphoserine phosphatase)
MATASVPQPPPGFCRDLDLVAEMTADFAQSQDVEEVLHRGLERIAETLGAEAASLFVVDSGGDLVCRACYGPVDVTGLRLAPGDGIVWRSLRDNRAVIVADVAADPDFLKRIDHETGFITRDILCAPMTVHDNRVGAIEVFNKVGGGPFTAEDTLLLQTLASAAALALVNARMAQAMAEQQVLKRELALAADIQRAMLPAARPETFPIHGINLPARGISGDFFDIVPLSHGRIAFAIGDVAGKGINAALLMAKTASLFRCLARRIDGPGAVLAAIDAELVGTVTGGAFVTMLAGILDAAEGIVTLASAGHEPPLLLKKNGTVALELGGLPPLGVVPARFAAGCPEQRVALEGGALYLFTDGLTEARASNGVPLEAAGVEALLRRLEALPAAARLEAAMAELREESAVLGDDATLLVVEDLR